MSDFVRLLSMKAKKKFQSYFYQRLIEINEHGACLLLKGQFGKNTCTVEDYFLF